MNDGEPHCDPDTAEMTVESVEAGERLDRFVKRWRPELSHRDVRDWIAGQRILCNGRPARKGQLLRAGDRLALRAPAAEDAESVPPDDSLDLTVLYEDTDLVALSKPGGIATNPLRPGEIGTVANGLVARYPETVQVGFSPREPGLLHRLDRGTSGVLLAARNGEAFAGIREQFDQGQVLKVYQALVHGHPPAKGHVTHGIGSRARRARRVTVVSDEKTARRMRSLVPAETHFEVEGRFGQVSLVRLRMQTGARHQLRAHMAFLGFPVVGDLLYGSEPAMLQDPEAFPPRHLLHAFEIRLFHPRTGKRLQIQCPLPEDFRKRTGGTSPG